MEGTGDMPEAWANANLVLLLRDMLLNERDGQLHLLSGLLSSWVPEGKSLTLDDAPVTTAHGPNRCAFTLMAFAPSSSAGLRTGVCAPKLVE